MMPDFSGQSEDGEIAETLLGPLGYDADRIQAYVDTSSTFPYTNAKGADGIKAVHFSHFFHFHELYVVT